MPTAALYTSSLHDALPIYPCIVCNDKVKFGTFLQKALELGCDYVATGHYARVEYDPERGRYLLKRGKDPKKDQSYTLYGLTQEDRKSTRLNSSHVKSSYADRRALHLFPTRRSSDLSLHCLQ